MRPYRGLILRKANVCPYPGEEVDLRNPAVVETRYFIRFNEKPHSQLQRDVLTRYASRDSAFYPSKFRSDFRVRSKHLLRISATHISNTLLRKKEMKRKREMHRRCEYYFSFSCVVPFIQFSRTKLILYSFY